MERLVAYALRIDGVHVIDGRNEKHAVARAVESGLLADECAVFDKDSDGNYRVEWGGFRTSGGRFVRGAEALEIALNSGQLRRSSWLYRIREPHGVVPIWLAHRIDKEHVSWHDVKHLDPKSLSEIESPVAGKIEGGEPPDRWHIVSRAIRYCGSNGEPAIEQQDSFSTSGRWYTYEETGNTTPLFAIEGYVLDNGKFITREDAKVFFPATDIDWEGASDAAREVADGPRAS